MLAILVFLGERRPFHPIIEENEFTYFYYLHRGDVHRHVFERKTDSQ